jgi:KUP system potassium uptake protein
MEQPDVSQIVEHCCDRIEVDPAQTTFYLGRARVVPTGRGPMMAWRKRLFQLMARNGASVTDFFNIPPNRVVELGAQIEL